METKMTERDKILLIILAIVIIVFGAVMIPSYGIMASINKITDANKAIVVQRAENNNALDDLVASGVPAAVAESPAMAVNRIKASIVEAEYDAVKISQGSLSASSTSVARDWLIPLAYPNYENGTDADKVLEDISVRDNEDGYVNKTLVIDYSNYETSVYSCTLNCTVSNGVYDYDTTFSAESMTKMCNLIFGYNRLIERGSVQIEAAQNAWSVSESNAMTWRIKLVIPQNSKIEQYKGELCECHHCGQYYTLDEYEALLAAVPEGEEVTCTGIVLNGDGATEECGAVWTGETLK